MKAGGAFQPKPFEVPGPCSYNAREIASNKKVSFSGRNVDLTEKYILSVPGPGSYQTLDNPKSHHPPTAKFSKAQERD